MCANSEEDIIYVRKAAYNIAQKMDGLEGVCDLTSWGYAEIIRDFFRDRGADENANLWHEVFNYFMTLETVSRDVTIVISDNLDTVELKAKKPE